MDWEDLQGAVYKAARRSTALAGAVVYVCDPHIPWQRGSEENTNGLLRQRFPRSTDAYLLDRQIIADVQR